MRRSHEKPPSIGSKSKNPLSGSGLSWLARGLSLVMKRAFGPVSTISLLAMATLCLATSLPALAALEPVARPRPIESPAPIGSRPVNIAGPKTLRVVVAPDGTTRLEGLGTPGSRVTVEAGGAVFGPVSVRPQGIWGMEITRVLGPGQQSISASASGAGAGEPVKGQEIRFKVPKTFADGPVVAYGGRQTEVDESLSPKRVAGVERSEPIKPSQDLSAAASRIAGQHATDSALGQSPVTITGSIAARAVQAAGRSNDQAPPRAETSSVVGWFKRTVAAFQSAIVSRLPSASLRESARASAGTVVAQAAPNPDPVVPPVRREQPATPPAQVQQQKSADKKPEPQQQAQAKPSAPPDHPDGVMGSVQDWLARANREYQGVIIKQLSLPPSGNTGPDPITKKLEEEQKADDTKKAAEAKRLEDQRKAAANAKLKAEEDRRTAEAAAAKAEEAKKLEAAKAEEAKKIEAAKKAEAAKPTQVEDAKKAEEARKSEEAKKTEASKKAEEVRRAEEAKKAEGNKQAEEAKKAEDVKKAEAARKTDEARKAEAARKTEDLKKTEAAKAQEKAQEETKRLEAAKAAESQKLKEAEQRRIDDERRKAEEARRQTDAKAQQEAKALEDKRRSDELEKSKNRARTVIITPEPITPRNNEALARDASGPEKSAKRPPDTRIAEGSAETGPVETEPASENKARNSTAETEKQHSSWRSRHHSRAHKCRAAGRLVRPPAHYVVARGDSLWRISARHYHAGRHYMLIYRANRNRISDPDLIYPCQRVLVPRRRHR